MSNQTDANKAAARRTWEEIFPACDIAGLAEVTAVDAVTHGARPGEPAGLEGVTRTMLWLASVFSDQRWEIRHVLGDGDMVAVHAVHHGRHTGNLMGLPPTGREVAYDYIHLLRFENGKAVEHWGIRDDATLMRQLGVERGAPAPAPTPAPAPEAVGAAG